MIRTLRGLLASAWKYTLCGLSLLRLGYVASKYSETQKGATLEIIKTIGVNPLKIIFIWVTLLSNTKRIDTNDHIKSKQGFEAFSLV